MERHVLIGFKESMCLRATPIVETAVYPTALNNVIQVKISLTVPDNVYFFTAQYLENENSS